MHTHNRPNSLHNHQTVANQFSHLDPTSRSDDPHIWGRSNKPSLTVDQASSHITRPHKQWVDRNRDGRTDISHSYRDLARGDIPFNARQKEQAGRSLQSWSDVANLAFREESRWAEGYISLSNRNIEGVAYGEYPTNKSRVVMNPNYGSNSTPALHNHGRMTLTHEVGHTLGLAHPGHYDGGSPAYRNSAEYAQDTRGHSIMSYFGEHESGQSFNGNFPAAPMMDDIASVQRLYGANHATRNTNTTYGFNSNTGRDFLTLNRPDDAAVFCVWDGGGNDTLDFSKYHQNQAINLKAGAFSDVGGLKGNVSIAQGVTVENAIGGSGHDVIIGNHANNMLKGGAGADRFRGGGGADTYLYDNVSDSTYRSTDQIMDFASGKDKIDLSAMLGKSGIGALTFVPQLSGRRGDAVLNYDRRTNESQLYIDTTGNGRYDFTLKSYGQINQSDIIAGAVRPHRTPANTEQIMGSARGKDKVDLSGVLGKAGIGALTFVTQLSGRRGEAVLNYDRRTNESQLYVDTTGNGYYDFTLKRHGQMNRSDIIVAPASTRRYA